MRRLTCRCVVEASAAASPCYLCMCGRSQARQSDTAFVSELCEVSLGIFGTEDKRVAVLKPLLESYLGPKIEEEKVVAQRYSK